MNKKYIFFIFCLIAWMGLYSQGHHPEREFNKSVDGKYLVDSTYIYLGNTFGQYWFNYLRYKVTERDQYGNFKKASDFEYDTINAVWYEKMRYEAQHYDSSTRRLWLGHTWDSKAGNWKMSDSIYSNPNGSIEISWYKVWDPFISRFYRGKRFKNEYSENGNLVKEDVLKFDTLTGGWKNDMVNFYEYNAGDLQIEKKIRKWNGQSWQDSLKIDFAYNDNKLLELEEYQMMSGSGIWENWQKWDFAYNATNQLREKYYSLWFSDDKSWKDTRYYIYTYDPDQRLDQILEKYWDDFENDWVDKYVTSYTYNAMGLRSEIKRQYWDPINGYWFHTSNIFYTYDDNRNLIEYLYRYWDEENGQWLNIYKDASYWSYFETQGIGKTEPSVVAVYPNPADDIIQLIFSKPIKQGQCSIYTTGGQFIQSIEVDNSTQFLDISRLPAGNYILGFWADGAYFSRKVVIR